MKITVISNVAVVSVYEDVTSEIEVPDDAGIEEIEAAVRRESEQHRRNLIDYPYAWEDSYSHAETTAEGAIEDEILEDEVYALLVRTGDEGAARVWS